MSIGSKIIREVREEIIDNLRDSALESLEDIFREEEGNHENFDGLVPVDSDEWKDSDFGLFLAPWAAIDKALDMANSVVDEILGEDTEIYRTPYDDSFDYSDWNPLLNPEDNYNRLGQGLVDFEVVGNDCEKCVIITFSLFGLLPLNPIIYCRRHESPECQEEPIPEGVEIEEEEENGTRRTEIETLPAGVYFLPFATEEAKKDRPWVYFLNEDGTLHQQNIKFEGAKRISYFAFRDYGTGALLSGDDWNETPIFYSDNRFIEARWEANWLQGEERERWKYVDDYGVPCDRNKRHSWEEGFIEEDLISYGMQPTFYPKIYCRATKVTCIKETHPNGNVAQNFIISLCSQTRILYRVPWRNNHSYSIIERWGNSYWVYDIDKIREHPYQYATGGGRLPKPRERNIDELIHLDKIEHLLEAKNIPRSSYVKEMKWDNLDKRDFYQRFPELKDFLWRLYVNETSFPYNDEKFDWWLGVSRLPTGSQISMLLSRGERKFVTHAIVSSSGIDEHFQKVIDLNAICRKNNPQEPQPPMSRCCSGVQCREIIKRLRNVERMIKKFEKVVAPDSFPARLPRKLIDPKNPRRAGTVKIDDYPEMVEYLVRQIDRAVGPPIVVSLDDANDAKEGNQPYEVTAASINDALRQLLQYTLESGGDIDTLTNMSTRNLFESAITHKISAETRAELAEITEWLGFEGEEKKEDIPFMVDPTLDGKKLDELTEEQTEAILGDFLKETKLGITYYENREENTLVTRLMTILKEANAAAVAVGTPVNSKWDIVDRLRSFDFNRVVGGLQLMKQIRESFLASSGDSESFLRTIDEIILRYTENASPISEDNKHDFQIEKNEETGKPTVEIEVTEHITDKADEFRHRSESSDFWSGKGFGGGKNYTERRRPNNPRR